MATFSLFPFLLGLNYPWLDWMQPEAAGSDTLPGSVEPVVFQTWLASQGAQELSVQNGKPGRGRL